MKALLATAACLLALSAGAAAQETAAVTVTFRGIEQPQGAVMFGLYDEAGYGGARGPVRQMAVEVSGPEAQARLEGLPPGRYAIKAFHDLNGDGRMNTNPFGLPTEPYAFSNDAEGNMGPASFAAAAFTVTPGETAHAIRIR